MATVMRAAHSSRLVSTTDGTKQFESGRIPGRLHIVERDAVAHTNPWRTGGGAGGQGPMAFPTLPTSLAGEDEERDRQSCRRAMTCP